MKKRSYNYKELISCANGELFGPGNAKLPSPPMLMFDRIIEINNNNREGGNNQKETLFILGKAISGAPIIIGTNQLPSPPIMAGMTIKKNHY